jgi:hypothetical protein
MIAASLITLCPLAAADADTLAGKRVVFLGDSITQAGGYVAFTTYYLTWSGYTRRSASTC